MKCNKCGFEISNDSSFCPFCGEKVKNSNKKFCKHCGNELKLDDAFCAYCGTSCNNSFNNENEEEKQCKEQIKLEGIKKHINSNLSLAIIVMTIITQVINFISNIIVNGVLSAIIGVILPSLIIVGMWKTYKYCKNDPNNPKPAMNLVVLSTQITYVIMCICGILVGIVLFGGCTCSSFFGGSEVGWFLIAWIFVFSICIIVFGFTIFYYHKLRKFTEGLAITIETGANDYEKHYRFIYVMQIIMAVFNGLVVLGSIVMMLIDETLNESLQLFIKELNLSEPIEITYTSSWTTVLACILSFVVQTLYAIGLKKFNDNYKTLE